MGAHYPSDKDCTYVCIHACTQKINFWMTLHNHVLYKCLLLCFCTVFIQKRNRNNNAVLFPPWMFTIYVAIIHCRQRLTSTFSTLLLSQLSWSFSVSAHFQYQKLGNWHVLLLTSYKVDKSEQFKLKPNGLALGIMMLWCKLTFITSTENCIWFAVLLYRLVSGIAVSQTWIKTW